MKCCQEQEQCFNSMAAWKGRRWSCLASVLSQQRSSTRTRGAGVQLAQEGATCTGRLFACGAEPRAQTQQPRPSSPSYKPKHFPYCSQLSISDTSILQASGRGRLTAGDYLAPVDASWNKKLSPCSAPPEREVVLFPQLHCRAPGMEQAALRGQPDQAVTQQRSLLKTSF